MDLAPVLSGNFAAAWLTGYDLSLSFRTRCAWWMKSSRGARDITSFAEQVAKLAIVWGGNLQSRRSQRLEPVKLAAPG